VPKPVWLDPGYRLRTRQSVRQLGWGLISDRDPGAQRSQRQGKCKLKTAGASPPERGLLAASPQDLRCPEGQTGLLLPPSPPSSLSWSSFPAILQLSPPTRNGQSSVYLLLLPPPTRSSLQPSAIWPVHAEALPLPSGSPGSYTSPD
jgi:hypothetical protein